MNFAGYRLPLESALYAPICCVLGVEMTARPLFRFFLGEVAA